MTAWRLIDNDLIVGLGQQAQSCQLILKAVYQTVNHQRCLVRNQWRLFTDDGLQLLPQWPEVVPIGSSPAITFTAYYAKLWDQRTAAPAVTSTTAGYQLQPTPPKYLITPESAMNGRFIEDLSALSDEAKDQGCLLDRSCTVNPTVCKRNPPHLIFPPNAVSPYFLLTNLTYLFILQTL